MRPRLKNGGVFFFDYPEENKVVPWMAAAAHLQSYCSGIFGHAKTPQVFSECATCSFAE